MLIISYFSSRQNKVFREVKDTFCDSLDYNDLDEHFPPSVIDYDGVDAGPAYEHVDKVEIGSYAVVGAGSVIIGDVESHSKVVGVSGKKVK